MPKPNQTDGLSAAAVHLCPACDGHGYCEEEEIPECETCDGTGAVDAAEIREWVERRLDERRNNPLERWADAVPCERCGADAGVPCLCGEKAPVTVSGQSGICRIGTRRLHLASGEVWRIVGLMLLSFESPSGGVIRSGKLHVEPEALPRRARTLTRENWLGDSWGPPRSRP